MQGHSSLPALRAWLAPCWKEGLSTGGRTLIRPNGTGQARSAGREDGGLASKMQNRLVGSYNCGGAPKGGTLSGAAGRGLAIHLGTGSGQPPYFGRNLTHVKFSPRRLFFLLDRVRPVFFFLHKRRKKKMGSALHQPSSWLNPTPPARAGITSPASVG